MVLYEASLGNISYTCAFHSKFHNRIPWVLQKTYQCHPSALHIFSQSGVTSRHRNCFWRPPCLGESNVQPGLRTSDLDLPLMTLLHPSDLLSQCTEPWWVRGNNPQSSDVSEKEVLSEVSPGSPSDLEVSADRLTCWFHRLIPCHSSFSLAGTICSENAQVSPIPANSATIGEWGTALPHKKRRELLLQVNPPRLSVSPTRASRCWKLLTVHRSCSLPEKWRLGNSW